MTRAGALALSLAAAAPVAFAIALLVGSVDLAPGEVLAALRGHADPVASAVVLELRLPRAAAAFAVGGLLAVAGALLQVLLRNPLADPYILGVSGGAAVAALSAILLGLPILWVDGGAFAGALGSTLLVFALARGRGRWTPTRLLLTGVVVAAGWGALISLLLAVGAGATLRGMLFWLMGDLSSASGQVRNAIVLGVVVIASFPLGRHLNVLARGELQAASVGAAVRTLQPALYVVSSLLTALAVTTAGSIGFVGLVVPHLIRLTGTTDNRVVLPCSALLGGILLVVADTAARTIVAPRQLPVGALTALIGVPLFLVLMAREARRTG